MEIVITFFISFFFSFIGSIPPGTLNLSVLQLGLDKKLNIALRFSLAAALIEYPYAWIAVVFEKFLTSSPVIIENFQLITGIVMVVLGSISIRSALRPTTFTQRFEASGFRRGVLLSILNPLAMPYWIAITAYLRANNWISLDTTGTLHAYLTGVTVGAFVLLILVAWLAKKLVHYFRSPSKVKLVPGITLLALGAYAFYQYLF